MVAREVVSSDVGRLNRPSCLVSKILRLMQLMARGSLHVRIRYIHLFSIHSEYCYKSYNIYLFISSYSLLQLILVLHQCNNKLRMILHKAH